MPTKTQEAFTIMSAEIKREIFFLSHKERVRKSEEGAGSAKCRSISPL